MTKDVMISVFETVGSPLCVASSDGQKVFDRLFLAMNEGRRVLLSFHNISTMTSAFLNAAIGQLYGRLTHEQIRSLLSVQDIEPDDLILLKKVVDTAKAYFQDPKRFDQAVRDAMENEHDDV